MSADPSDDRRERLSDSPFVQAVTRIEYAGHRQERNLPDGRWDFVIFRNQGHATILLTGTTTRPITSFNRPGDELLCISFKAGVYMPLFSPPSMRDTARLLPRVHGRSFALGSQILEIPNFENADDFVAKLTQLDLLVQDELVDSVLSGEPRAASPRSLQRHFLQATGLPLHFHKQIQRAQRAADLLRTGRPAADVAAQTGFTDQSHMIHSLKALLGQTPSQIVQNP